MIFAFGIAALMHQVDEIALSGALKKKMSNKILPDIHVNKNEKTYKMVFKYFALSSTLLIGSPG
jgi:hypothetical protein